jgi:hypothetical protein
VSASRISCRSAALGLIRKQVRRFTAWRCVNEVAGLLAARFPTGPPPGSCHDLTAARIWGTLHELAVSAASNARDVRELLSRYLPLNWYRIWGTYCHADPVGLPW